MNENETADYIPVTMPLWIAEDLAQVLDAAHDHALDHGSPDTPLACDLRYHAGLHRARAEKTHTLTPKETRP
jgi:hypothetical protein